MRSRARRRRLAMNAHSYRKLRPSHAWVLEELRITVVRPTWEGSAPGGMRIVTLRRAQYCNRICVTDVGSMPASRIAWARRSPAIGGWTTWPGCWLLWSGRTAERWPSRSGSSVRRGPAPAGRCSRSRAARGTRRRRGSACAAVGRGTAPVGGSRRRRRDRSPSRCGVSERLESLKRSWPKSGSSVYGNRPLRISVSCRSVIPCPPATPST